MNIHRKIVAIIVLIALSVAVAACRAPAETGFLGTLDDACYIKIRGERNGVAFEAEITLSARNDSEGRGGVIRFSAPSAMAGIEVRTEGGVWGMSLDGIELSGISAERLGAPMAVFINIGEVVSAEKADGEEGRTLIVTQSASSASEYLIDSKSGWPVSVKEKDSDGNTVMEFEVLEYNVS